MSFVDFWYLNVLQSHGMVTFSFHLWFYTPSINTNHNYFDHVSASYPCSRMLPFTIPQEHTGWPDFLQMLLTFSNFFSCLCCIPLLWLSLWAFFFLCGLFFSQAAQNSRISCSARSSRMAVSPYFFPHLRRYIKWLLRVFSSIWSLFLLCYDGCNGSVLLSTAWKLCL